VIFGDIGVEDSEGADNFAAGVREQRKLDLVGFAERGKSFARVVRDRRGVVTGGLKRRERLLQLDELVCGSAVTSRRCG